jgi:presenilin-like A22 family membrane protease
MTETQTADSGWRVDVSDDAIAGVWSAIIMLGVQVAALAVVASNDTVAAVDGAEQTRQSAGAPLSLGAVLVGESLAIVLGWRIYQRLGDTWQRRVRRAAMVAVYLLGGQLAYLLAGWTGVVVLSGAVGVLVAAGRLDIYWLFHNSVAILLAVVGAVLIGTIIGPLYLAGVLVALIAWDRVAVTDTNIMQNIVAFAAASNIPAYIVLSRAGRLDIGAVEDCLIDEGRMPDGLVGVIGTGDFVFPSALVVSLAIAESATSLPVVGAVVGAVAAAWLLWQHKPDGDSPGLPALNGGALAGGAIGVVLNGLLIP